LRAYNILCYDNIRLTIRNSQRGERVSRTLGNREIYNEIEFNADTKKDDLEMTIKIDGENNISY
jgi:hypothetical protein